MEKSMEDAPIQPEIKDNKEWWEHLVNALEAGLASQGAIIQRLKKENDELREKLEKKNE